MVKIYAAKTEGLDIDTIKLDLPKTQLERIEKFKNHNAKKLSVAGGLLIKYALGKEGIYNYDIRIGEHGKPYLAEGNTQFNISHSGERVMCAVSHDEVGCDVQEISHIDLKIADRFFSKDERDLVYGAFDKTDMFFRIWALRESFIKATGYGMSLCQDKFSLMIKNDIVTVAQNIADKKYCFKEFEIEKGYKYAVCSTDSDFTDIAWVDIAAVYGR